MRMERGSKGECKQGREREAMRRKQDAGGGREKLCVSSILRVPCVCLACTKGTSNASKAATRATEAETQTRIACVCLACIALLQLCCNFCVFLVCALRVSKQCASVSPLLLL
jgi:hypothetical protein